MTVKEKGVAYFVSPLGFHLIAPALLKRSLIDVKDHTDMQWQQPRESIIHQNSRSENSNSAYRKFTSAFTACRVPGSGFMPPRRDRNLPHPVGRVEPGGGSGNVPRQHNKKKRKETSIEVITIT